MAPVLYEFLILTAAAHVPVIMMNIPDSIRKTLRATRSLYFIDLSVARCLQLSCNHIHPFEVMHMKAPNSAPIREVRSPKKGMAMVSTVIVEV